jgi:hypothetical protein
MECQLRPLVYSLGLNNLPRQGKLESRALKSYDVLEFSLLPSSALKFYRGMPTFVPQNAKGLRRSRGLWHSAENLWVEPFSLWHSAVKFYQGVGIPQYIGEWWLAFRSMFESCLPRSYSCCGNPRHLTTELGKWPNSSARHFTSTVPLFVTS